MVDNPRFPHWCKIYRIVGEDAWNEGTEEIIYEGKCRKWNNDSLRNFYKKTNAGRVADVDYCVSVPPTINAIRAGYLIDVIDKVDEIKRIPILDVYMGNMGSNLYINKPKN